MVRKFYNKIIHSLFDLVSFAIILLCYTSVVGQDNSKASSKSYSRLGVTTGFSIFDPGESTPIYGSYTIKNLSTGVFHLGISYALIRNEKWNLNTGLIWSKEPDMKFELSPFLEGDVFSPYEGSSALVISKISSYSIPIHVERHFRMKKNLKIIVLGGVNLSYLPQLYSDATVILIDQDPSQEQEVFNLILEDNGKNLRAGLVLGTGVIFPVQKILQVSIKANYTMQFKNSVSGIYEFHNFFNSPPSGGNYSLSGNYFQVSFGFQFLKKK